MTRKFHIVGNWKMNQSLNDIKGFFSELGSELNNLSCEAWLSPQTLHLTTVNELAKGQGKVLVGAQNCSHKNSGAFTGDTSSLSIKDAGLHFTLIGHSERRSIFNESNEILNEKTKLALENGLTTIFCVGETLEERESGNVESVISTQLEKGLKDLGSEIQDKMILAYEPVWAIGTGKVASPEQAEEVHAFIRKYLSEQTSFIADKMIILYGGSVKPSNVDGLLTQPNIDGALVGGASLKAADFKNLCIAASK